MNLLDSILGDNAACGQLASQFGLSSDQVGSALKQIVPALGAGLQENTQSPDGIASLMGALSGGDHATVLDDTTRLADESTVTRGNGILGHLLGSKDASRAVADAASTESGVDAGTLRKMLPVVSSMLMGVLAKKAGDGGSPESMIAGLLGGGADGGSVADTVKGALGKFF